jgi:hypothetical protein
MATAAPSPLFVKVSLPPGLEECLEEFTLEVLRKKPVNLKIFAQQHFEKKVKENGGERHVIRLPCTLLWAPFPAECTPYDIT